MTASVMQELRTPRSNYDVSLRGALVRGHRLKQEMIDSLETWLIEHADV